MSVGAFDRRNGKRTASVGSVRFVGQYESRSSVEAFGVGMFHCPKNRSVSGGFGAELGGRSSAEAFGVGMFRCPAGLAANLDFESSAEAWAGMFSCQHRGVRSQISPACSFLYFR